MVCVTLEGLWIISNRIVDFRFFVKFHRSGPAIFFSFWTITEHVLHASKSILIKEKPNQHGECSSRSIMDDFWYNCRFSIFWQFSQVRIWKNFQYLNYKWAWWLCIKKAPNQAKDLINKVYATLERLWMVSDRNIEFRIFVKFHRSRPATIFSFWIIKLHVSYSSKMLLIKERTSSTWWVLLWKYMVEFW